ncbi:MAG: DNA repair protein RecN [Gammaproteobacteria bacterium]
MLLQLNIKNFALIDELAIEFKPEMTVLTGETGAGKSIIIDTLDLVLGGRADADSVRLGAEKCEISAVFDLSSLKEAKKWLEDNELAGDDANECILRRSVTSLGKTRSTINGNPVTLQQARELGSFLVNIHGQHEHQFLLKNDKQRDILDLFAQNNKICNDVKNAFLALSQARSEAKELQDAALDRENKLEFLRHQVQEFKDLVLEKGEVEKLLLELKELGAAQQVLERCNVVLTLLSGNDELTGFGKGLHDAKIHLEKILPFASKLKTALEFIDAARQNVGNIEEEIRSYLSSTNLSPERLHFVENRLGLIHDLARKHRVSSEKLLERQAALIEELELLENAEKRLEISQEHLQKLSDFYMAAADKLSQSRKDAALKLSNLVTEKMQILGMPSGEFSVLFKENAEPSQFGLEQIEFLVSTNVGQPLLPLAKIVSGGELSRISLALQVITAANNASSTLVFDEVDVGIGGKTAEIVGQLLAELGKKRQILCITHLPQVAVYGSEHLQVEKKVEGDKVSVHIASLSKDQRTQEIARMLGGISITAKTLAHAKEMLSGKN